MNSRVVAPDSAGVGVTAEPSHSRTRYPIVKVATVDGLSLAAYDVGPRDAPACIFLHGIAQSKQIWAPLFSRPLAQEYRLIALDMRGHGESDTPSDPGVISRSKTAHDLAAVIDGLDLHKPSVVAWSFGGVVVGEYLRQYGEQKLRNILFLAASIRTGRDSVALFGPTMLQNSRGLMSDEAATYEATARTFVQGCASSPLPSDMLDAAVAEMLLVPTHVRRTLLSGGEDYSPDIARTTIPMATLHGEKDAVVLPAMSDTIDTLRPGGLSLRITNAGHLPWVEASDEFDAALHAFLRG